MRFDHRTHSNAPGRALLAFALVSLIAQQAHAQRGKVVDQATLKEPSSQQVYQRDRTGRADIPVSISEGAENSQVVNARLSGSTLRASLRFEDGKLRDVPTGGPYTISATIKVGSNEFQAVAENVFVGDLWVLAGQSNMQGVGDLIDVTAPHPQVSLLGMNGKWSRAEEPLHWLVDSPDPVHSGDPETRAKRSADEHKARAKGAGLGLAFASAMVQATRVPVGLIACAHGGTSMAQWNPSKKTDDGQGLYGSMLRQVKVAGGRVKGVLWYQGEAEAGGGRSKVYPKVFADFIAAVRADLKEPDLPFYYVQIGRFIHAGDPKEWNAVQDAQRLLAEQVPNTAVVAVIDLELDDLIHVGTQGLKRAGQRLAKVALRELFGQAGATTPTLDRVNKGGGNTLVVKFKGVNIAPEEARAVPTPGFGMGSLPPASMTAGMMPTNAPGPPATVVGLKPSRHIAGFSIRGEDGSEIPLIFDAAVGTARDTVILKLIGPLTEKAELWYGHGYDPDCNLTDGLDMAVPAFGPVPVGALQ